MRAFHLLLLSSALVPSGPALASAAGEIVVTATGAEQDSDTTGRSITVLDRALIETRQTVVASDLLARTPGVSVTRNGSIGGLTTVRIRGAEGDHTLVLIDGIRVNDPASTGGAFDFATLLAGSIERIEVLRGPNSVAWGSQAIGGVVNISTIAPTTDLTARAGVEYGHADTLAGNATVTGGSDRVRGAISGVYLNTDGISQSANGTERDGFRQYGASGRLDIDIAEDVALDLRGYYAHSRVDLDGYPAPLFMFADTDEFSETQEAYGYAGIKAGIGPVRNQLSFTLADINRDNYDPASGAAPIFLARGRTERLAYQGDAELSGGLRLIAGADREWSRFSDGFNREKSGITSAYAQAVATPVAPLTITAGLRHDDHDDFGGHTTWGANLALRATPTTLFRASYGEGFKAPTLYQLFSFYGDESLRPETAKSYEAGIEQRLLDGKVRLAATWFRRTSRNQIDFLSCWGVSSPICLERPDGFYANIAGSRSQGVEFELTLAPAEGLSVVANYSFLDSENRSEGPNYGNRLARRPRNLAHVSVDYRTPWGPSLGTTLSMVDDSFDDAGNFRRLEGYALVDLRAEWPVTDRIAVYGRIENVTDARYQTVAGYGTAGRSAFAGVRVTFD